VAAAVVAAGALVAVALLGPRPEVVGQPVVDALPEDLDAWVAAREAGVPDVVPGTEGRIVWAGASGEATQFSVVYLHGFSGSRQETAPLAERIAAALGANLFETRLTGHGRYDPDAMGRATADDWLHDAAEAAAVGRRLGERRLVLGVSSGGTLATWLAASRRLGTEDVVVLLSPNFRLPDARAPMLLWPWGRLLARIAEGEYREWEPHNERHAAYWTTRYPSSALVQLAALMDTVEHLDLTRVRTPTLVLYGPDDSIVDPERTVERFGELASAPDVPHRLVPLNKGEDPDGHVMAGDILSPSGTYEALEAVRDFLAGLPSPPAWSQEP